MRTVDRLATRNFDISEQKGVMIELLLRIKPSYPALNARAQSRNPVSSWNPSVC